MRSPVVLMAAAAVASSHDPDELRRYVSLSAHKNHVWPGGQGATLMEMKLAPLSLAAALATSVLPQPGGPYSSTPVGANRPSAAKRSGSLIGWVMEKASSSLTCEASHNPSGMRLLFERRRSLPQCCMKRAAEAV